MKSTPFMACFLYVQGREDEGVNVGSLLLSQEYLGAYLQSFLSLWSKSNKNARPIEEDEG